MTWWLVTRASCLFLLALCRRTPPISTDRGRAKRQPGPELKTHIGNVRLHSEGWPYLGAIHGARVPLPWVWKLMFVATASALLQAAGRTLLPEGATLEPANRDKHHIPVSASHDEAFHYHKIVADALLVSALQVEEMVASRFA